MTQPHLTVNNFDLSRKMLDISYHAGYSQAVHRDHVSRVSFVISGKLMEEVGKTKIYAQTGAVVIKPDSVKHKNQFGPRGARMISFLIDDSLIKSIFPDHESPWRWFSEEKHAKHVWKFLSAVKLEKICFEPNDHVIELISNLISDHVELSHRPPWLDRVLERIHDEYSDSSLMVRDLAKMASIHPVYLARAFRKFQQCSVKDYICQLRLQRASHQLSSTTDSISQIAYSKGFSDQSHMTRLFKAQYGISPGHFRRLTKMP